jgi:pimeloyl-ACP methyl ester carboxylesterase
MPLLERDDIKLHYEVHGDAGAPVVILTHGYTATAEMWNGQIGAVTGAGFRLLTWDIRGHGQTLAGDDPARYTPLVSIDDMAALLDAVAAPTAVIGGLSLGGYLSLAFNLSYPERVRALMLFDTGPGYRNDDARE